MLRAAPRPDRLLRLPPAGPASTPTPALPAPLTSFVGRDGAVAEIGRLLADARLVTLTGAGGVGKTRLALETADVLRADEPDGVWLVELAALADPALVPQAVADALGVREAPGRPLVETLAGALHARRLLLILDNCEHLVAACADLVVVLLGACPGVRALATSREVLGIVGEVAWRVPPLTLPPGPAASPDCLLESEAVQLFVERARRARPGFTLTDANAAAVAHICARLDGIPLAIELAAARLRVLSVEQVAARLDDRFGLLTTGDRTALPRHQTLRATVEWSYGLLDEPERRLFARLAVFAGGFTLEAAEAVCEGENGRGGDGEQDRGGSPSLPLAVLDVLARLVDKSLVLAEERDGEPRYRMLETLRQYAEERLTESGDAEAARRRHAAYFAEVAERNEPYLGGGLRDGRWLGEFERERENLRAALGWATGRGAGELAVRLAGALASTWWLRGAIAEGRHWLEAALATAGGAATTPARARALIGAGLLARSRGELGRARGLFDEAAILAGRLSEWRLRAYALYLGAYARFAQGDHPAAAAALEEALDLFGQLGDALGSGRALNTLGQVVWARGDAARAEALLEESRRLLRGAGSAGEVARNLATLGDLAWARGELARARACYAESLALRRATGDAWSMATSLAGLGAVALAEGDPAEAARRQREALGLRRAHGDRMGLGSSLDGLAALAAACGQPERAARLFGAAAALRARLGMAAPLLPAVAAETSRQIAGVRRRLGEADFAAAWAAGQSLTPDEAAEEALTFVVPSSASASPGERAESRTRPRAAGPPPGGLTRRELDVAALLARGRSNRAIAESLSVSERTVEGHVSNILSKLGFDSRAQAALWAVERGLAQRVA